MCLCAPSLESSLTLCDPMDCKPPGSSFHRILQAKYWSGLPCPPPGDLPDSGIEPASLRFFASASRGGGGPGRPAGEELHTEGRGRQTERRARVHKQGLEVTREQAWISESREKSRHHQCAPRVSGLCESCAFPPPSLLSLCSRMS